MNMQLLARLNSLQKFDKGAVVLKEGDDASKGMVYILQGDAGLFKNYGTNSQRQVDTLVAGSYYGADALFLGKGRSLSLVTLGQAVILFINKQNVYEFFKTQPEMVFGMIQGFVRHNDGMATELEKLRGPEDNAASQYSALFPEGHGSYTLPLMNQNEENLYIQKVTCSMCSHVFDSLTVIISKLKIAGTDKDMRTRYKDVEPLYYDVVTCPNCFFSATADQFDKVSNRWAADVAKAVGPYRLELYIRTGQDRDTFSVFAGYYLAALCIPFYADDYQLARAANWMKISRLYQDCEDNNMYLYASKMALDDYLYAYQNFNTSPKADGQMCYIIGDLYLRIGEIDKARIFFFNTKSNKAATSVIRRQAENMLDETKIMLQEQKEQAQ